MTIAQILQQARTLSPEDRKELVKQMIDLLEVGEAHPGPSRRLSELRGLGKEIWEGIDAQDYVDRMRSEWDSRS